MMSRAVVWGNLEVLEHARPELVERWIDGLWDEMGERKVKSTVGRGFILLAPHGAVKMLVSSRSS